MADEPKTPAAADTPTAPAVAAKPAAKPPAAAAAKLAGRTTIAAARPRPKPKAKKVDIDTSPLMGLTEVDNLYISGGWGTGGFKAIPAGGDTMAYTIARDKPHPLIEGFALERFTSGALIDEGAASGVSH